MKVLLFTHIDLDGMGCSILFKSIFSNNELEVRYVNYDFELIESNRKEFYNPEYDKIYLTDISVSREFAKGLNNIRDNSDNCKVVLLDHHKSAESSLSDLGYDWIHINQGRCGTLLTYQYLLKDYPEIKKYSDLVKYINDYDLWNWNYKDTLKYQILFSVLGRDEFVSRFVNNCSTEFTDDEEKLINFSLTTISNNYKTALLNCIEYTDIDNKKFMYIHFTDSIYMISYVLYKVLLYYKDKVDYVVAYTRYNSISLRSLKYDVSTIAESLGGGGHKLASGVKVPTDAIYDLPLSVANREWTKSKLSFNRGGK